MFDEKYDSEDDVGSLCMAMQAKDRHRMMNILRDNCALIRYKNQLEESVLHFAVKYNFEESIEYLIERGLSVNSTDCCNRTPLHFAIASKNECLIKRLLAHNASTNLKNLYGKSPFHLAVNFGDLRIIQLLLASGADVMDPTSSTRQTSLHMALRNEDERTFEFLLKNYRGDALSIPDAYGDTILHALARQRNETLAKLSIDRGADVDFTNNDNETPLHLAIHRRNFGMCKLLVDYGGANVDGKNKHDESPLHLAIRYKDAKLVELLLDFDANVDQRANDDDTMLHVAVNYYNSQVVDLLMKRRVDVDVKNAHGLTPFHTAIKIKCIEAARQLLREGKVDVNSMAFGKFVQKGECQNYTPLHTAIAQKDLPAVRLLLENGAIIENEDDREIFLAVQFGCASIVDFLVVHGANVNARTSSSGRSLLYVAMKSRDRGKVEMLLRRGADPRNVDETDDANNKESALHLAVRAKDEKFVRFLLDIGADVNVCNANEATALCLASWQEGNIANIILARIALLKANGCFVCTRNETAISVVREFAKYFVECCDELRRIESTRYGDVSLIEFLRNDARFWGRYVRRGVLETMIDEKTYPTYWRRLLVNIEKGATRWNLIRRVKNTLLREFQCFQRLYDVLDDIVDNFNDDELDRFIRNFNDQE